MKYSEKPSSVSKTHKSKIWNFPFTDYQIDELKDITDGKRKLYFIFICGDEKLNKSKLAVISSKIIFQCIDLKRKEKYKAQSIKIRLIKNHWNFDVYGTSRNDKSDGIDKTFKVRISNINEIFGFDYVEGL